MRKIKNAKLKVAARIALKKNRIAEKRMEFASLM